MRRCGRASRRRRAARPHSPAVEHGRGACRSGAPGRPAGAGARRHPGRIDPARSPRAGRAPRRGAAALHRRGHPDRRLRPARGRRIAVLAVDPGSKRGGGAILGDKTRMAELARAPGAFIRPSSAGAESGGVARRTREAILVCEAAGYDTVVVETVGAGQAETRAAELVDMFVLVLPPAAGDELQGLKRGIIELADLVLVNKADGDLAAHAQAAASEYANALRLIRPGVPRWQVPVRAVSALTGEGIDAIWDEIARFRALLEPGGEWAARRAEQACAALWAEIGDGLAARFRAAPAIAARLGAVEREVKEGARSPAAAARELLALFLTHAGG